MTRMNFYWYIIYRLHQFFSKKDITPISDVVMVMCFIHSIQILTLLLYLNIFINIPPFGFHKGDLRIVLPLFIIFYLYYLAFFKNGKWKLKVSAFKVESIESRIKHGKLVWLYCWGSIIFFLLSLPITFTLKRFV